MSKPTTVRLPPDLEARLDAYLDAHPGTQSEVIARALDAWLTSAAGPCGLLDLLQYVPLYPRDGGAYLTRFPLRGGERIWLTHDGAVAPSFHLVGLYVRPRSLAMRIHSVMVPGGRELLPGESDTLRDEGLHATHFGWPVGGPTHLGLRDRPFVRAPTTVEVQVSATRPLTEPNELVEVFLLTLPPWVPVAALQGLDASPSTGLPRAYR